MKKVFLLFLILISNFSFSQTLERQLYTKYFKPCFVYEPAVIRKQHVEVLEIQSSEYRKDSLTFTALKEKAIFRKDGRPCSHVIYEDFHRDSTLYDYRYDTLGNLIEYKKWKPKNRWERHDVVLEHVYFKYSNSRLEQVFSYYMSDEWNTEILQRCDSLNYESNQGTLVIYSGNEKGFKIGLTKDMRFIYPINTRATLVLTATVNKTLAPPVDDEAMWNEQCVYESENLKMIQKITGTRCIDRNIQDAARVLSYSVRDSLNRKDMEISMPMHHMMQNSRALILDTVHKELIVKSELLSIQPTSMEDRVTRTVCYQYFTYDMRLQRTETREESSRGTREFFVFNSFVDFLYFDFGFVSKKREVHLWENKFTDNKTESIEPIVVEELMRLVKWE